MSLKTLKCFTKFSEIQSRVLIIYMTDTCLITRSYSIHCEYKNIDHSNFKTQC